MNKLMAVVVLLTILVSPVAQAERDAKTVDGARKILAKNRNAVIWVTAVVKTQFTGMGVEMGPGREEKVEAMGTVIDPSGLTVLSYSMLDPISMVMRFAPEMMGGESDVTPQTRFSDVKMLLPDGTEVPAKLIMKDSDLDLAFVIPDKAEGKDAPRFDHVDMSDSAAARVLDELVFIGKLGKSLDRQTTVCMAAVTAIVEKPRSFYCVSDTAGIGVPAFSTDGKVLGICLMRKGPQSSGLSAMISGGMPIVILPAGDVMEIAAQALKQKDKQQEAEPANSDVQRESAAQQRSPRE